MQMKLDRLHHHFPAIVVATTILAILVVGVVGVVA